VLRRRFGGHFPMVALMTANCGCHFASQLLSLTGE
jgi:hypothetical protein